ncbi:MAG: hypothetical protein WC022_01045 [Parcubacteria group bacterium]
MSNLTITDRMNETIFELLEQYPAGLRWSELLSKVKASDSSFHPKTINGSIWKLISKYPEKVYKPSKGVFRLLKYRSAKDDK